MVTFVLGAGLVALVLAASVFTISRGFLVEQREHSAARQAATYADFVNNRLTRPGAWAPDVLAAVDPPVGTVLLLHWQGEWFASDPGFGPADLPGGLHDGAADGQPATVSTSVRGEPFLAVGIPIDGGAMLYEFAPLDELQSTLRILSTVIVACAAAVTLGGAAIGLWASRAVLRPLHQLAGVTARIAGGELDTRLSDTDDRDLVTIVASFNSMVDSLQQRIERERRFFGDVSHELRTPLTTLVTGVEVLRRHEADLPERSRRALDLVAAELNHLRRLLDDLLALAKIEAGLQQDPPEPVSLSELLTHTLAHSGRPISLLTVDGDATISGRKLALERALVNLMDNADQHGQGLIGITVQRQGSSAVVIFDDAGTGVALPDRGRIFERFATAGSRDRSAGTGLGLALVTETVAAHGGDVACCDRPGGGARFVVRIPAMSS